MAETGISMRYGFVGTGQAEALEEPAALSHVILRVFQESEDCQWSLGAAFYQLKAAGLSLYSKTGKEKVHEMHNDATQARKEGKVPFRVAREPEEVSGFLEEIGLIELDLIPLSKKLPN